MANKTAEIFSQLAKNARHLKWKGCGFIRLTAELANKLDHPAVAVGASHKKKFEAWLPGRYEEAWLKSPESAARSVVLLMEGAFSTVLIHRDPGYAETAAETARGFIEYQKKK